MKYQINEFKRKSINRNSMNNSPVSSWKMAFLFINFPKYFYDFFLFSFFLKNKEKKKKKGKKKKSFSRVVALLPKWNSSSSSIRLFFLLWSLRPQHHKILPPLLIPPLPILCLLFQNRFAFAHSIYLE